MVVGGKVGALGTNAWLGKGEFLVAEADESDGSFNRLTPVVVVVTNVDREHMDHYGSEEALEDAFVEFMNKVPVLRDGHHLPGRSPPGRADPPSAQKNIDLRIQLPGRFSGRDYKADGMGSLFNLYHGGEDLGTVRLSVPGRHNVLNALGALGAARELGVDFKTRPWPPAWISREWAGVSSKRDSPAKGPW